MLYRDRANPTPVPVIRRRGIALVKVHNGYRIAYDPLLYIILGLISFVSSPRSWKVVGRKRVSKQRNSAEFVHILKHKRYKPTIATIRKSGRERETTQVAINSTLLS